MKDITVKLLKECENNGMEYATILFHDCYFCKAYQTLFQWYQWLIKYILQNDKYKFISFTEAIKLLDKKKQNTGV